MSGGNFLINVLLARNSAATDFGTFAICFVLIQFLVMFHNTTVGYSLVLQASDTAGHARRSQVVAAFWIAAVGALAIAMLAAGAMYPFGFLTVLPFVATTIFATYFHETGKHGLIASGQFRGAVVSDLICYGGRILWVVLFAMEGATTLENTFAGFTLFSALGGLFCTRQLKLVRREELLAVRKLRQLLPHYAFVTRWSGSATIITILAMMGNQWVLAFAYGTSEVAKLQALSVILGFSHPLIAVGRNVMVPIVATSYRAIGYRAARNQGLRLIAGAMTLVLPLWIALAVFPRACLDFIYGSAAFPDAESQLAIYSLGYMLYFASMNISNLLAALRRPKESWSVQAANGIAMALLGIPMTIVYALNGAVSAVVIGALAATLVAVIHLRRPAADASL